MHCASDGAGQPVRSDAGKTPFRFRAKSNGGCDIQTGSFACSLKTTSGQPLPVRFHSWIFVCIVVAPLPSPS